ncbi:type I 3-dehydroquinate dehydratase [Candidatus Bathyarchaeota archaeon]|nr:MAG: type I 3-dehydroquinate dehydratase [Candidatus Bathyarchaeota archaeon]
MRGENSILTGDYRVCVCIKAKDYKEAVKMLEEAEALSVDLAEVRLDHMTRLDGLEELPRSTKLPLIATLRPKRQGGMFEGEEAERVEILRKSAVMGFEYVDLELDTPGIDELVNELKGAGVKVIVSHHDFERTPGVEELRWLLSRELSYRPDVCKLVTYARSLRDNLVCLTLLSGLRRDIRIVCFAMGKLGLVSRVLSPLYGGFFTYASLRRGLETAPGQLTVEDLRTIVKLIRRSED